MPICERCGAKHDGSFGSGRFCSRSCANARDHSDETKQKTSNTLKERFKNKYGEGISTLRDLHKLNNEAERANRYREFVSMVETTDSVVFLKYPNIDFGDRYAISNTGEIFSLHTGGILSTFSRVGYRCISLLDVNGNKHNLYVHRLVAYNFIPNPNNYPIINHKDENRSNNNISNLEWCTVSYNNTYNDAHLRRAKHASETFRKKKLGITNDAVDNK